jgi:membrane fusion protein (multidrug efflux system)
MLHPRYAKVLSGRKTWVPCESNAMRLQENIRDRDNVVPRDPDLLARELSPRHEQAALAEQKAGQAIKTAKRRKGGVLSGNVGARVGQRPGDEGSGSKPVFTPAATHIRMEANLKENQLDHMRIDQPATFKVDAFRGFHPAGTTASLSPDTGNSFALLSPEGAFGNRVEAAQRLPVEYHADRIRPIFHFMLD